MVIPYALAIARNRFRQGIRCYEQALGIAREIGNCIEESVALGNLGSACQALKEIGYAVRYNVNSLSVDFKTRNSPKSSKTSKLTLL